MKPFKLDHIGIAVHSIEAALPLYTGLLELTPEHEEVIESQGVRAVFIPLGESLIELLEPTHTESPIAKFLEKKGQGIHHVAYAVEDIRTALTEAKEKGYRLIDESPRLGGHGKEVAFMHPNSTHGVLIEFCRAK
jgi:methylmalonyl-CoA epimerase